MVIEKHMAPTEADLRAQQRAGLWFDGHASIQSETDAVRFMRCVGFALRYNSPPSLPLAAVFSAVPDKRHAIEQKDGTCWCGGTTWQDKSAMRISASS